MNSLASTTVRFADFARANPATLVRLSLRSKNGATDTLVLPAAKALAPNRSMRFFMPTATRRCSMPYYYDDEVTGIALAEDGAQEGDA